MHAILSSVELNANVPCCAPVVASFPLLAWLGTIPNSLLSLHPTIDHIYTIYIFYIYTNYTCTCVALTMDPKQLKSASTVRKMKLNYKNNANNTSKANVKENTIEGGRHTPPPPSTYSVSPPLLAPSVLLSLLFPASEKCNFYTFTLNFLPQFQQTPFPLPSLSTVATPPLTVAHTKRSHLRTFSASQCAF